MFLLREMTRRISALNTASDAVRQVAEICVSASWTFSNDEIPQLRKKSISSKQIFQMNERWDGIICLIRG